jgi:hypothetical protein
MDKLGVWLQFWRRKGKGIPVPTLIKDNPLAYEYCSCFLQPVRRQTITALILGNSMPHGGTSAIISRRLIVTPIATMGRFLTQRCRDMQGYAEGRQNKFSAYLRVSTSTVYLLFLLPSIGFANTNSGKTVSHLSH